MEYDLHTLLDALTLVATVAIIYCMTCTNMKVTYQKEQDTVKSYFVVSGHIPKQGCNRTKNAMLRGTSCLFGSVIKASLAEVFFLRSGCFISQV